MRISYSSIPIFNNHLLEFFSLLLSSFLRYLSQERDSTLQRKKKPIGTDARPLTDNPTWVLSQTNCKWFGHLVWRIACGRRARDYSRIRHRRSLEISVYMCVCVCACVKCFGGSNRGKRNRSSIEEERSKEARIGPSHRGSSRFAFFSKATRFKKVNIH